MHFPPTAFVLDARAAHFRPSQEPRYRVKGRCTKSLEYFPGAHPPFPKNREGHRRGQSEAREGREGGAADDPNTILYNALSENGLFLSHITLLNRTHRRTGASINGSSIHRCGKPNCVKEYGRIFHLTDLF